MTKRTYNPEDYSLETQAAMKELLDPNVDEEQQEPWVTAGTLAMANIIEKAVLKAKQVTEDKVRAACASVAEAHLNNSKTEV